MLYDPKWEDAEYRLRQPATFIAWLERQPARGKYNYIDCKGKCLNRPLPS